MPPGRPAFLIFPARAAAMTFRAAKIFIVYSLTVIYQTSHSNFNQERFQTRCLVDFHGNLLQAVINLPQQGW